jgi:uncharacterized membrane protein
MKRGFSILGALGIGAGLMYLFDPQFGNRRRSLIRDQATSLLRQSDTFIEKAGRDIRNRARGVLAETTGKLSDHKGASDWVLEERVRANIGRITRHPGSVEVTADQGRVTLSGPILKEEVDRVVSGASKTRGVKEINNRLEVHESAENIPGLQGHSERPEPRPELLQENWSPTARLVTGAGGLAMTTYGLARRGLTGTALSLVGLGLATRGITNQRINRFLGLGSARNAVEFHKTININAPVEEVYRFWENVENYPRFMEHVKEIIVSGDNYHWTVAGPAGTPVEFDTVMTRKEQNRVLAWKSRPNETIKSAGIVQFQSNPEGGTRVTVRMSYTPPAGALGHAVAALFGVDPKQAMDSDLARMKTLLEEGKTTAEGKQVTREEVSN